MTIVSFGCSLTFGTDLPDSNPTAGWPTASNLTWPALISKRLDCPYLTRAKGGSGNLCISDRVSRAVHYFVDPNRFFIINWTFIDRFDFSHPTGIHFNSGPQDYITCRPNETDELSQFYYRNFHSEYRDKFTNLMYIKLTVDILQKHRVKFAMTTIDDQLWCDRWHAPPHILEMQQEIRPYVLDFEGRNFLDWSQHHGFDISSTGHPLVEAHQAAADVILPKIKNLLKS
jgi:hypothetical protein